MMRTTITLEDDVAAALARLEKEGMSAKEAVNTALREFVARRARRPRAAPYTTPAVDLGKCLLGSVDDVAEALSHAEGDQFR